MRHVHVALLVLELLRFVALLDLLPTLPLELLGDERSASLEAVCWGRDSRCNASEICVIPWKCRVFGRPDRTVSQGSSGAWMISTHPGPSYQTRVGFPGNDGQMLYDPDTSRRSRSGGGVRSAVCLSCDVTRHIKAAKRSRM
jgi:hypothetical protein